MNGNLMDSRKFYSFWSISIVASVILLAFSLIFVSCSGNKAPSPSPTPAIGYTEPSPEIEPEETPTPTPEPPPPTLLAETEDMGQAYLDKIIFLGDSTTYGLRHYEVLSGGAETTQVWTPESGTFSLFNQSNILIKYPESGENVSIEKAVMDKKPEYMIINLGVNGVASMGEDYFKDEYKALLRRIQGVSPDTKIILSSMYPVARTYGSLTSINNTKITTANTWVYDIAEEMGLRYINVASVLRDSEGWLPASFQNGDGLHLSKDALLTVLGYIRTHGYR